MKRFATSLLRRCRHGLLSLFVSGGMLGGMLMGGMIGVPLALVSPQAMAACNPTMNPTTGTFTFTAANLYSDAQLSYTATWVCTNGFFNSKQNHNPYICYESTYDGAATNGANSIPYYVGFSDSVGNQQSPMTSGTWYGVYNNGQVGTTNNMTATVKVTVPAGMAAGKTAGTYSDGSITFALDEQGGSNGGVCEEPGGGGGYDSGSSTVAAYFSVPASCALVSTPAIDFGNVNPGTVAAPGLGQTGIITVKCTSGTNYTVYLGDGNNRVSPGSGMRQMANGTARLAYQLYKTAAHTTVWDATGGTAATGGSGGQNGTGTGVNVNWTVYAFIPIGTSVPFVTGTYTDTVVVTVTY